MMEGTNNKSPSGKGTFKSDFGITTYLSFSSKLTEYPDENLNDYTTKRSFMIVQPSNFKGNYIYASFYANNCDEQLYVHIFFSDRLKNDELKGNSGGDDGRREEDRRPNFGEDGNDNFLSGRATDKEAFEKIIKKLVEEQNVREIFEEKLESLK